MAKASLRASTSADEKWPWQSIMGDQEGLPELPMLLARPLPPHLKCTNLFFKLLDMSFSLFMSVTGRIPGLTPRKELLFQILIFIRRCEFPFLTLPPPYPNSWNSSTLFLRTHNQRLGDNPVSSTFLLKVSFHLYTHWTHCPLRTVFSYSLLQQFWLLWSTGPGFGVRRCLFCPSLALLGHFPL